MKEICFGGLLRGKILQEANIKNEWHYDTNLKKNWSVLLYLNTLGLDTLILCLVGVSLMLEIQKQHKTFIMPSVLTSTQKNNCLRFLINRIIIELLLKCIEWLRNIFLHLLCRENVLSHSAVKMHSYEKIFPRLTEILVSFRRDVS